ncbi:hypothetical protein thsps117_47240 [Pseudomonas sp. No.117]
MLQQILELGDLLADRALGQRQFIGRTGKAQVARDRLEALHGGDGRQVATLHERARGMKKGNDMPSKGRLSGVAALTILRDDSQTAETSA